MNIPRLLLAGLLLFIVLITFSPFQIAFIETDSMSPVIQPGDVYFINTNGDYEVSDIITFFSEERGQLTTHRIADETPRGFITKGDNNPSTDQRIGEPPVTEGSIRGEVVEIADTPITVPAIGFVSQLLSENQTAFIGLIILLILFDIIATAESTPSTKAGRRKDEEENKISEVRLGVYLVIVSLVVLVTMNMIAASSISERTVVVQENPPEETSKFVRPDNRMLRNVTVETNTFRLIFEDEVSVSGANARIENFEYVGKSEDGANRYNLTYYVGGIEDEGVYPVTVTAYAYPNTLPDGFILVLHELNPVVASLFTISILVVPLPFITLVLLGRTEVKTSTTDRYRRK